MARWLGFFTAQDLADALRVPVELADKFVTALLYHEQIEDTGEVYDGPDGLESVYEMPPLPPGPTEHPHATPVEIMAVLAMGGFELFNERGMPVRIRTERDQGKARSTPGSRQKVKNQDRAYKREMEAKARRATEQAEKAASKVPKWLREKRKRQQRANKKRVVFD